MSLFILGSPSFLFFIGRQPGRPKWSEAELRLRSAEHQFSN